MRIKVTTARRHDLQNKACIREKKLTNRIMLDEFIMSLSVYHLFYQQQSSAAFCMQRYAISHKAENVYKIINNNKITTIQFNI